MAVFDGEVRLEFVVLVEFALVVQFLVLVLVIIEFEQQFAASAEFILVTATCFQFISVPAPAEFFVEFIEQLVPEFQFVFIELGAVPVVELVYGSDVGD